MSVSQLSSAQDNPYDKTADFGVAYSDPLQSKHACPSCQVELGWDGACGNSVQTVKCSVNVRHNYFHNNHLQETM